MKAAIRKRKVRVIALLLGIFLCNVSYSQQVLKPGFSDTSTTRSDILLGADSTELAKFIRHYHSNKDSLKRKAAKFLASQMNDKKFSFTGDLIHKYDTVLSLFKTLRSQNIFVGDPSIVSTTWKNLLLDEGRINIEELDKNYDSIILSSTFLIENTESAFEAWQNAPSYVSKDFSTFCDYVLPHRVGNEEVENFRNKYYKKYRNLVDSAKSPEDLIIAFNREFVNNQQYRSSLTLWEHPLDFSITQMELGRRGACRQLTNFCALAMRATGLPVAIDRAIWANRSVGHSWNVLLLDSNKILPFDAFEGREIIFDYKPAKIFRKKFSSLNYSLDEAVITDLPTGIINPYEHDVTGQYCKAFDIEIPILKDVERNRKKYGVICVFDNKQWRIVHYGRVINDKLAFSQMASDVAYLAAFYDNGVITPASEPFLLKADGTVKICEIDATNTVSMKLTRKYPMFPRIRGFAMSLRGASFETSDDNDFKNAKVHFSVFNLPFRIADSIVNVSRPYRYIRFKSPSERNANIAEVEFYGKLDGSSEEVKLSGRIIGYQDEDHANFHPFEHAMDGNLETYFEKKNGAKGWVGLDLGENNKYVVTRVRFCPRSDTNFILIGDKYELKYWDGDWKSFGVKVAESQDLHFDKVPKGSLFLLHNQSRGREERIFTYEDGKQVWW